jgi:DNA-3-methyladenine glycosylase I
MEQRRCAWAGSEPLYLRYHDREWGVPQRRDRRLFEMLILEGAQAGLSWLTILRKRQGYRRAFAGFDPQKVARFNRRKIEFLLRDEGIVRNRLKVQAAVTNARVFLEIQEEWDGFHRFVWEFVGGEPIVNRWRSVKQIPASTVQSDALSKELRKRGMKFVGSTICDAFMQATGMVNDHTTGCFRYRELLGGS